MLQQTANGSKASGYHLYQIQFYFIGNIPLASALRERQLRRGFDARIEPERLRTRQFDLCEIRVGGV